jgi:uncharacterized OB-fold protein
VSAPSTPVAADLMRVDGEDVALLGSRCSGCGTRYFPRAVSCRNPDCDDKALTNVGLGRTGELYSWTVQHYQPPALFRVDAWTPYAVGLVELPEGLRVLAMLTGAAPGAIPIGAQLRLTTAPLYRDSEGRSVVTYAYAPTEEQPT